MSDNLHNSRERYGRVAQWLHWIIAIMITISFLAIYYRLFFTESRTPPSTMALQIHMTMGITIFTFVILRLFWKFTNVKPDPVPSPVWQQKTASWTHRLFYFFLIAMPITGYLAAGLGNEFFYNTPLAFEFPPKFTDTQIFQSVIVNGMGMTEDAWKEAREPLEIFHVYGGTFIFLVLIFLHIGAALYHHFHLRDNTLKRMTSQKD